MSSLSDYIECPGCIKQLKRTTSGKYRKHLALGKPEDCDFSGTVVQEEECPPTEPAPSPAASSVRSSRDDVTDPAEPATPSTESCPPSPEPEASASTASAPTALPGVEQYVSELTRLKAEQTATYRARVEENLTPFSPPAPIDTPPDQGPLFSQPVAVMDPEPATSPASPPASLFSQPAGRKSQQPVGKMTPEAAEVAARVKELFYAYDNRRSTDNRSAQATMGPSEMGTPCDRRLALSLMRMPPVNPGGDGWAAFVGTSIHSALEQMFMWADAGTGRFAVEQRLEFGSVFVPKGTADLIDRILLMVIDHKCQGRWSRNKLKTTGLSPTYKVQAHTYAHGARLRGEKIEKIAIISWPRDEATLEDLWVHVEDYDPLIVKKAFERVEKIGEKVLGDNGTPGDNLETKALLAKEFNVADDCRFCPFFLPNARDITRGCNGKR